ncbi:hypothetical protein [Algoriphagus antarcticus]|uniref:Uncharacterized protein n=1 Tax=Algoriphagus antarcticus TaxID=238540 RepID=A0A3E0D9P8_9BACT|nr:hypothetical protein [Algoriphagus antarcticus]REG78278.1 hypothetical protein C8N25_13710 [Algoriphagus antarcticus]
MRIELAIEEIICSNLHENGVAVRFTMILGWCLDKKTADANTLENLIALSPE